MDWQATEARTLLPGGVAEALRRIVAGDLTPETTLPNLDWLANQFAKSRMTMCEAIKLLAGKGLVSSAPRRGRTGSKIAQDNGSVIEEYLA